MCLIKQEFDDLYTQCQHLCYICYLFHFSSFYNGTFKHVFLKLEGFYSYTEKNSTKKNKENKLKQNKGKLCTANNYIQ